MAAETGTPSRHEKSLGLLTTKFVSLLQEAKDGVLDLKVVCIFSSSDLLLSIKLHEKWKIKTAHDWWLWLMGVQPMHHPGHQTPCALACQTKMAISTLGCTCPGMKHSWNLWPKTRFRNAPIFQRAISHTGRGTLFWVLVSETVIPQSK